MSDENTGWDVGAILGAIIVYTLPLTLLIPNFSIWDVVPKVHVHRFHVISQQLTWPQLNGALFGVIFLFMCLYIELRKRRLEELVENVMVIQQATDSAMASECQRQADALHSCAVLLDSSTEHYEHLALLGDALRFRKRRTNEGPPSIQRSNSTSVIDSN